jgi:hypothetical protein
VAIYGTPFEAPEPFQEIGSIAAAITTPAVGARDAATVEALSNVIVHQVEVGLPGFELRFRANDANNGSIVIDALHARDHRLGQDHYTRACTITLTVGQQTADTGYTFIDTAVVSNDASDQEIVAVSPANDYIASVRFNTNGYGRYVFLATTLTEDKTVDVDLARLTNRCEPLKS